MILERTPPRRLSEAASRRLPAARMDAPSASTRVTTRAPAGTTRGPPGRVSPASAHLPLPHVAPGTEIRAGCYPWAARGCQNRANTTIAILFHLLLPLLVVSSSYRPLLRNRVSAHRQFCTVRAALRGARRRRRRRPVVVAVTGPAGASSPASLPLFSAPVRARRRPPQRRDHEGPPPQSRCLWRPTAEQFSSGSSESRCPWRGRGPWARHGRVAQVGRVPGPVPRPCLPCKQ